MPDGPIEPAEESRKWQRVSSTSSPLSEIEEPLNEEIIDLNSPYQDPKADVILVSADTQLQFRCDSFVLMTGSIMFRDMFRSDPHRYQQNSSPRIIRLTDEELEHARAIRFMLDAFYSNWDSIFRAAGGVEDWTCNLVNGVKILDKYDFGPSLAFMLPLCQHVSLKAVPAITGFVIYAHLDDVERCSWAIRKAGSATWSAPDSLSTGLRGCVTGASHFDVRGMPRKLHDAIPVDYLRALLRATSVVNLTIPQGEDKVDWNKVADEFKRLMSDQGKPIMQAVLSAAKASGMMDA